MKSNLAILTILLTSSSAFSQSEITLTKQEFIDHQVKMFGQLDANQAQAIAQKDEMMKSQLSKEAYAEYKKEDAAVEQEELKAAADCLGISTKKLESITNSIGSAALVEAANACSKMLPESITISGMDWSSTPSLAEYNSCNEQFIAEKSGVPLEKYKQCAAKQDQN